MRTGRLVGFIIAIGAGLALGLWIGWQLIPRPYANTAPSTLRSDYQTDYVLMVAEVYQADNDLSAARERLNPLEDENPLRLVQQSIVNAQSLGYASADIQAMAALASALQLPTFSTPTVQP